MKTRSIAILIADDHPVFRHGLKEVIESRKGFRVVAEASDGEQALRRIEEVRPDVALLDVDMPVMNGFEVARAIQKQQTGVHIVFLTMHKEEDLFDEAMGLGVRGYVLKENAVTDLLESIATVASGGFFLSPQMSHLLVAQNERARLFARKTPGIEQLTLSERRVLSLIAENKTSKEIAGELFISHKTVDNHRTSIARKLRLRGSHKLLKFAIEHKSSLRIP